MHIISEPTVRLPPTYTTIWHGINANYSPLKRAPVNKGGRGGHLVKIKILVFWWGDLLYLLYSSGLAIGPLWYKDHLGIKTTFALSQGGLYIKVRLYMFFPFDHQCQKRTVPFKCHHHNLGKTQVFKCSWLRWFSHSLPRAIFAPPVLCVWGKCVRGSVFTVSKPYE